MELKHDVIGHVGSQLDLLIVPYGIETLLPVFRGYGCRCLLIVPYGIETNLHTHP